MNSHTLGEVYLDGVGLIGSGLTGWHDSAAVLAQPSLLVLGPLKIPVPESLPAAERRRVGNQIKMALAAGREATLHAGQDAASLANIFSASHGDGDNCHAICEVLAGSDRSISPTRFHNSVHNAAAGYWGIAMKCMAPSTSLCAFDGSFAAGLLEACVQSLTSRSASLLVASDAPYPEPLNGARPMEYGFAVGLVIQAVQTEKAIAKLRLSLTHEAPDRLQHQDLERLRAGCPAARSLPLLIELASSSSQTRTIHLEYLANCALTIRLENI